MHEKIYDQIDEMDEKVTRIASACLDNILKAVDVDKNINTIGVEANTLKSVGEALKALADGLESYRAVTKAIEKDATPKQQFTTSSPTVGGQL